MVLSLLTINIYQPYFLKFIVTILLYALMRILSTYFFEVNAIIMVTVQCRNMRNRIFRNKEYSLLEQVPISVADFNALAARNYEGTE